MVGCGSFTSDDLHHIAPIREAIAEDLSLQSFSHGRFTLHTLSLRTNDITRASARREVSTRSRPTRAMQQLQALVVPDPDSRELGNGGYEKTAGQE